MVLGHEVHFDASRTRFIGGTIAALLVSVGGIASPSHAASCGKVTYMNGTVGPSVCPNGKPNKRVKNAYTRGTPAIMGLKSSTTRKHLITAMCADTQRPGNPAINDQIFDAIDLQTARYD